MLEHGAEIAAIDPASASGALDEMFGLIGRWSADGLAPIFAARDLRHSISSYSNATPSGSFSLNHSSAAASFANTFRCLGSPTS